MNHDNYDRAILRALESIADSLERIESYLRPQMPSYINATPLSEEEIKKMLENSTVTVCKDEMVKPFQGEWENDNRLVRNKSKCYW